MKKPTIKNTPELSAREKRLTRIFQIGFNKCGTRSFHRFFQKSGIPSVHYRQGKLAQRISENIEYGRKPLHGFDQFVAYTDMQSMARKKIIEPSDFYKELWQYYPRSYFILNTRNKEDWINSRLKHGAGNYPERFRKALRLETKDEVVQHWSNAWDRHHAEVKEFFADKPNQLLVFDIDKDDPEMLVDFVKADFATDAQHFGHEGDSTKINVEKYKKPADRQKDTPAK